MSNATPGNMKRATGVEERKGKIKASRSGRPSPRAHAPSTNPEHVTGSMPTYKFRVLSINRPRYASQLATVPTGGVTVVSLGGAGAGYVVSPHMAAQPMTTSGDGRSKP